MSQSLVVLTSDQLEEILKKQEQSFLRVFRENISSLKKDEPEELLTTKEACQFLKISSVSLWKWREKGRIKAFKIHNKTYYKRSQLLEALTELEK